MTNLHGEVISWELPKCMKTTHAQLQAALDAAGLSKDYANELCFRHAFVRAIRELSKGAKKIIRIVEENKVRIVFQFTKEHRTSAYYDYNFEALVTLDKVTGVVSCSDDALRKHAQDLLDHHVEARRVADVSRLLQTLFDGNADLFAVKRTGGVYFVPDSQTAFLAQIEVFLTNLGGTLNRLPVFAGTPQGDKSVQTIVKNGLEDVITEYEEAIAKLHIGTRDATLDAAAAAVSAAERKIVEYQSYLGTHAARLEDHAARVQSLLATRRAELEHAKAPLAKNQKENSKFPVDITDSHVRM